MLAGQGNEVVGYDPNKKCIEFCEYRKKEYKLKGDFTTQMPDISEFGLIICIGVLPLVEKLKDFLYNMGGMKYGAKLYHSEDFDQISGGIVTFPMRYPKGGKYVTKWLKESGMIQWDEKWCVRGGNNEATKETLP